MGFDRLTARIASTSYWAKLDEEERNIHAARARRGLEKRHARDAGLTGDEPPEEYHRRLALAKQAHMLKMVEARRRKYREREAAKVLALSSGSVT